MVIKQQYLIYNQVAPPHMVLKNKNKFTKLRRIPLKVRAISAKINY